MNIDLKTTKWNLERWKYNSHIFYLEPFQASLRVGFDSPLSLAASLWLTWNVSWQASQKMGV